MIGERLKQLRKERKISQSDLASIIGVQSTAVSRYETNKDDPSDRKEVEISKYLDISLDYLLGVIDEPVSCYNQDKFLKLPDKMTMEERTKLIEYLNFLEYRRNMSGAT